MQLDSTTNPTMEENKDAHPQDNDSDAKKKDKEEDCRCGLLWHCSHPQRRWGFGAGVTATAVSRSFLLVSMLFDDL